MSKSVIDHHARDEIQQRNRNRKTKTNASFNNATQESIIHHAKDQDTKSVKSRKLVRGDNQTTR